jgi:hypothetical protein
MIASESLSVSKSLLAKLMATENLTVEEKNVQTASFDVKNRVLTIPILDQTLSPALYDLFTGHEVGHALWTLESDIRKGMDLKIPATILNLVEDSRIERKIKNKYPGLRKSFIQGYSELVEKDFFGTKDTDLNQLNLLDRINMHCKGGAGLNIKFSHDERDLVRDIENTETYDDVIEVSQRLYEFCKLQQEKIKQLKLKQSSEDGDDDDSNYDYDFGDNDDPEYDELESSDVEDPNGESDEDEDGETGSSTDGDREAKVSTSGEKLDEIFRSFTDESYKKNEKKLFQEGRTNYVYVNIPKVDIKEVILDHKDLYKKHKDFVAEYRADGGSYYDIDFSIYQKMKKDTNKVVSYLVKEFEMRKNADQLKRATVAKTGELNMGKIYSYGFSEDIFKKVTVVPGGKSHGLVMFLDWSGSMCTHLENTIKQLLSLVLFCKKVNIPYEVYAFSNEDDCVLYRQKPKIGELRLNAFKLLNVLSSRMSAAEFTYAASVITHFGHAEGRRIPDFFCLSGTPLNEAIIAALEVVPEFQKKNKLQIVNTIVLSDGDGHSLRTHWVENPRGSEYELVDEHMDYGTTLILRDPVTKNQELCDMDSRYGSSSALTKSLIKLLRQRTGSNVVGFYVLFPREFGSASKFFHRSANMTQLKEDFKKDKFVVVKQSGYSEYYLLKSETKDADEPEFVVRENATTRGLVSAFAKYTNGRVSNRVVLNRFIGLIA